MTPFAAYVAGLLTLPLLMVLIALARPAPARPADNARPTSPPKGGSGVLPPKDVATVAVGLEGIDRAEADLARITAAAERAAARLREVAELGERIAAREPKH